MTATPSTPDRVRLLGNRILEGPNLYFPRPAVKVTLEVACWQKAPASRLDDVLRTLGARRVRVGEPDSAERDRAVMALAEMTTRNIAALAGTVSLGVRVRHGEEPDEIIVAFPWNRRGRAAALGRSLPAALTTMLTGPVDDALAAAAEAVNQTPPGQRESMPKPRVPVISITGTNGKTTTTRLVAHISMCAGRKTAWSSTDGVLVMGHHVERGDFSGPAGARAVLATPGLEVAVLETARGGMLNRGMGVPHNDVSVVTNVSPDHLGTGGIDTVDQLAEVKAIITKVTKPNGWTVLNGDDPRVWAMRVGSPARPICFTLDPDAPCIREARAAGGKAFTVIDDWIVKIDAQGVDQLIRIEDVPMTLSGLSEHNIANALAGAAGALALGLPRIAVVEGLRTFNPDAALNPGRMNVYSVPLAAVGGSPEAGTASVIIDMAHNEGGLEALLGVGRGLIAPGGRLLLGLGTGGDRTNEILTNLGEMAGRGADIVHIVHKEHYLRGRSMEDLESYFAEGLARVGVEAQGSWQTELEGLQGLLAEASAGDVVAVMTHSHQREIHAWIEEHGGSVDDAATIRRKVLAAKGVESTEGEPVALSDEVQTLLGTALVAMREAARLGPAPATLVEATDALSALPHTQGIDLEDLRRLAGLD